MQKPDEAFLQWMLRDVQTYYGTEWAQYYRMLIDGDFAHADAYADDHGLDV